MQDMSKFFQYDQITMKDYLENAGLTTVGSLSEHQIFLLRSKGFSLIEISLKLNCSIRTVSRRIQKIKYKIFFYELKKTLLK